MLQEILLKNNFILLLLSCVPEVTKSPDTDEILIYIVNNESLFFVKYGLIWDEYLVESCKFDL